MHDFHRERTFIYRRERREQEKKSHNYNMHTCTHTYIHTYIQFAGKRFDQVPTYLSPLSSKLMRDASTLQPGGTRVPCSSLVKEGKNNWGLGEGGGESFIQIGRAHV